MKDKTQIASKPEKVFSLSTEVQRNTSQTTLGFHWTPVTVAVTKKQLTMNAGEDVDRGEPLCIAGWCECRPVQLLLESV